MIELSRLAGAILLASSGRHYLIGNPKEPCDWAAAGFAPPGEIDAVRKPCRPLEVTGEVHPTGPWLRVEGDGEALAAELATRLLIHRNGSVSERLWNLIAGQGQGPASAAVVEATWLVRMPRPIWDIVRDAVLRCS